MFLNFRNKHPARVPSFRDQGSKQSPSYPACMSWALPTLAQRLFASDAAKPDKTWNPTKGCSSCPRKSGWSNPGRALAPGHFQDHGPKVLKIITVICTYIYICIHSNSAPPLIVLRVLNSEPSSRASHLKDHPCVDFITMQPIFIADFIVIPSRVCRSIFLTVITS